MAPRRPKRGPVLTHKEKEDLEQRNSEQQDRLNYHEEQFSTLATRNEEQQTHLNDHNKHLNALDTRMSAAESFATAAQVLAHKRAQQDKEQQRALRLKVDTMERKLHELQKYLQNPPPGTQQSLPPSTPGGSSPTPLTQSKSKQGQESNTSASSQAQMQPLPSATRPAQLNAANLDEILRARRDTHLAQLAGMDTDHSVQSSSPTRPRATSLPSPRSLDPLRRVRRSSASFGRSRSHSRSRSRSRSPTLSPPASPPPQRAPPPSVVRRAYRQVKRMGGTVSRYTNASPVLVASVMSGMVGLSVGVVGTAVVGMIVGVKGAVVVAEFACEACSGQGRYA